MNKALALEVARELGMSPEKVNAVCKSFHDGLRQLLLNPQDVKGGILITEFLSINLKEYKLKDSLGKGSERTLLLRQELVDNIEKYKRNDTKKKQT